MHSKYFLAIKKGGGKQLANSGSLQIQKLKLKYNFKLWFSFWGCSSKNIQQIQTDIPLKRF